MKRHLVLTTTSEFEKIILGKLRFLVRFFKKKPEFLKDLETGDLIFLRKKGGEVIAQFNLGKLIFIDNLETSDDKVLRNYSEDLTKELFEQKLQENSILVITQIEKLEQFITSPIDVPGNLRKDWVVLD